jgi:hypothetical protein
MKPDKSPQRRLSHWPEIRGFLLPVLFAFFVTPTIFTQVYIFDIAFPKFFLLIICTCLFSIGCLRYKQKDKGVLPGYAGFGFGLFIGSLVALFILISRVAIDH